VSGCYGEAARLRLQQILFYKELRLDETHAPASWAGVAEVLDQPDFDVATALQAHRPALQERVGRLRRLIDTVDQTIAYLKGDTSLHHVTWVVGMWTTEVPVAHISTAPTTNS
jgi:hypothetical protein